MLSRLSTAISEFTKRDFRCFFRYLLLKEYYQRKTFLDSLRSWYRKQLFLEQVTKAGSGLKMGPRENTIKRLGDGADIILGNDITIYSPIHITTATHIFPESRVKIGDRTRIGPHVVIRAAKGIEIGMDCIIASYTRIYDYNGHPLNPGSYADISTLRNRTATPKDEVSEIKIGNGVWVGENAFIQRGVTIADGSIVAANSVVIKDVPKNTVVFGVPARVILWLDKLKETFQNTTG